MSGNRHTSDRAVEIPCFYLPEIGDILSANTDTFYGAGIRWAQDRWHRKWCEVNKLPYRPVFANHTGLIVGCSQSQHGIGVGETLTSGSVITPWEEYCHSVFKGECRIRVYAVRGATEDDRLHAAQYFVREVAGKKTYDFMGIRELLARAMFAERLLRKTALMEMTDKIHDNELENWCTESTGDSWRLGACKDVLQDLHPIPMTVEQCAGEISTHKRKTLIRVYESGVMAGFHCIPDRLGAVCV